MARILVPGSDVGKYRVVRKLSVGAMAVSYEAVAEGGRRVFLKQYKSPSPPVAWYAAYLKQQDELRRRIERGPAKAYCYEFLDFFEATAGGRCYFQAFEFVDGGSNLRDILDRMREDRAAIPWERRLILARVMVTGLAALHDAKVVHCDLKPDNVQLVEDSTIRAGYRLKLIDMDFSILADRKAAWHGAQGYVGSPGYWSPEHLFSPPPTTASDVFSCGIMLYELLGGGHPLPTDGSEDDYKAAVKKSLPPPRLEGTLVDAERTKALAAAMRRCLSTDPGSRPTAKDLQEILRPSTPTAPPRPAPLPARTPAPPRPEPAPVPAAPAPPPVTVAPEPARTGPSAGARNTLRLHGEAGPPLELNVATVVGKELLRRFGEDARFAAPAQMRLEPDPSGGWSVAPEPEAVNETLLNGKAVTRRTPLSTGDVLSLGREARGISKLPIRVSIG